MDWRCKTLVRYEIKGSPDDLHRLILEINRKLVDTKKVVPSYFKCPTLWNLVIEVLPEEQTQLEVYLNKDYSSL